MWYDILIDTFLCGASGYITNKYAIDMMFKKYSIFNKIKCNGNIMNSKMQFIKNVSVMMEKDVINAQKISEKFMVHSFNEEFENFSKDFFDECVCRDIKSLRLKDIPVFYDACCCAKDISINILENNVGSIFQSISDNVELSKIITEEQVTHISKKIIQNMILTIQNTRVADDMASEVFDAFCDVKINEIITKGIAGKMKNNIEKETAKFPSVIKNSMDDEIYGAINRAISHLDISNILEEIEESILKKPIKNMVKFTAEEIRQSLKENITDFISTEKGEMAITNIYYELKSYLSSSNLSLNNIYKKSYAGIIKDLMQNRVNNIVYSVIQWIDSNNADLNDTIRESINEIIPGNSELKNKIFSIITEYYSSQKHNNNSMFKLLLEFASNGDNLDKISSFMTAEVGNYLKSKSIDEIINDLENKRIISANKLTALIAKFVSDDNKTAVTHIIDKIISKPIGEFINLDLVRIFNSKLKYIFIDYIKENTFYSKEIHSSIVKEVNEYVFDLIDTKIGEIVSKNYVLDSVSDIKRFLINDIKRNEDFLVDKFNSIINDFISKNKISDILSKLSETNHTFDMRVSENLTELINKNFTKIVDDIGDIRVSRVLSSISKIPDIHDSLSGFMKDIVGQSIATITEGYISEAVNNHFDNIQDDAFTEYIKNSTFTEPEKFSINGGIIGGALGLAASITSVSFFNKELIGNIFSWQGAVLASMIGVSTNIIAMNGFSTSYIKMGIISKIPLFKNCTEEFIKEKQAAFADYMADIVNKNLIDEDTVQDLVQSKSTLLKENIYKTVIDDEYRRIYECFENNNKYMSSNLSVFTKNTLGKNKDTISGYVSRNIGNIPIKLLINRNAVDSIMDNISSKKDEILNQLFDYISNYLEDNLSIVDCIPKDVVNNIKGEISINIDEQFVKYAECLKNIVGIKKYYGKYKKSYDSFLAQPLLDVVSQYKLDNIYSNIFNNIYDGIFTEDKLDKIFRRIHLMFSEQYSDKMALEDILNRKSKVLLIGMLYKYFKDIIIDLQNYLNANRHTKLEREIREKLTNSMNLKEKSSYNAIGGDKAIFDIVNNLVLTKLPMFFDRNFEQFYEISKILIGDIFDKKLCELDICIDEAKFDTLLGEFFISNEKNPIIKNKGYLLFNQYMQKYNNIEFKNIARYLSLDTIDNVFAKYGSEIAFFLKNFYNNVKKDKVQVLSELNSVVEQATHNAMGCILIKKLFYKIDDSELMVMDRKLREIIEENDLVYLNIKGLINNFYNYLEDMDVMSSILDTNNLKNSIENVVACAVSGDKFSQISDSIYSQIISNDLKMSSYVCITRNVKKYFTEILADGFYLAIKKNMNKLFQSINLDDIAREEILKLPPEKYQEIYEIFWKENKKNMIFTGLAGGVMGANKYAGIAISALEAVKGIFSKLKRKKLAENDKNSNEELND